MSTTRTILLSLLLLTALAGVGYSQGDPEPTPTPKHPLQDELDDAEMRQKLAEARKGEFDARFPKPSAEALATTNSVSGELIEARIQAYKAMDMISAKIAENVKATKIKVKVDDQDQELPIKKLYIYREDDFAKISAYKRVIQQLLIINAEYKRCIPPKQSESPGIGLLANMAIDWMGLLKQNTTIVGDEIEIGDEAVWASLGYRLSKEGITLANPFASGFEFMTLKELTGSVLANQINAAERYLQETSCATGAKNFLAKPLIDAAFKKLKEDLGIKPPKSDDKPAVQGSKANTGGQNPVQTAQTGIKGKPESTEEEDKPAEEEKPEPAGGIDLWEYLRIERILNAMDAENAYWIKVKNAKSGGNVRTKESPLIDIFRGGSTVKFSGGSVTYYYILDNYGKIVISGVESAYVPYQKSHKVGQ